MPHRFGVGNGGSSGFIRVSPSSSARGGDAGCSTQPDSPSRDSRQFCRVLRQAKSLLTCLASAITAVPRQPWKTTPGWSLHQEEEILHAGYQSAAKTRQKSPIYCTRILSLSFLIMYGELIYTGAWWQLLIVVMSRWASTNSFFRGFGWRSTN